MIQYTTARIAFVISDIDLTDNKHVWVTLSDMNGKRKITYENPQIQMVYDDPDTDIVIITTQKESGSFPPGTRIKVQVNYMTPDGLRRATSRDSIVVEENLLDQVLSYA